jgi:Bacterial Ig-like domain (group 2)
MKTAPALITLLALCACSGIMRDDDHRVSGTIVLASNEVASPVLQAGPYISVVDRVDIRATNAAGELIASTSFRLQRYDQDASATLEVPEGSITFSVDVTSASGIVLYSGSATAVVPDGFEVDVPLTAQRPVLVVQPDTIRTTLAPAQFTVYNGGPASSGVPSVPLLDWTVNVTSPNCAQVCIIRPFSGRLAGKQSDTFEASVPLNQASGTYQLAVNSPEGGVTAVWVYTRPAVIGFSVSPKDTIIAFSFQYQLTARTQSGPSNASWTSADTRIATVTPAGRVTGVGLGTTWIHAVSQVITTVRDSARVEVQPFITRVRAP